MACIYSVSGFHICISTITRCVIAEVKCCRQHCWHMRVFWDEAQSCRCYSLENCGSAEFPVVPILRLSVTLLWLRGSASISVRAKESGQCVVPEAVVSSHQDVALGRWALQSFLSAPLVLAGIAWNTIKLPAL